MPSRKESGFIRYQHVERLGTPLVQDIEIGEVYIFPKLDGTNASVWLDYTETGPVVRCGSRNRVLTADNDNAGFYAWVQENADMFHEIFDAQPTWTIYGEWLVPHTMKTYRAEAWRNFFVFDVREIHPDGIRQRWVPYLEMVEGLLAHALSHDRLRTIPPLAVVKHPSPEDIQRYVDSNTFLIQDGSDSAGEGVVLKNYGFFNEFGAQVWAKVVRNEFKDRNREEFGHVVRDGVKTPEIEIVERIVTPELVAKERAKMEANGALSRQILIPRLLSTMFHVVVTEELWNELKRLKNPTIDFRLLQRHVIAQTKAFSKDLF